MSYDEFCAVLARITMKNPPFPVEIEPRLRFQRLGVAVRWRAPDRDTGKMVVVTEEHNLPPLEDIKEVDVFALVHHAVVKSFIHECDECFHVDGVRTYDPHRAEAGLR